MRWSIDGMRASRAVLLVVLLSALLVCSIDAAKGSKVGIDVFTSGCGMLWRWGSCVTVSGRCVGRAVCGFYFSVTRLESSILMTELTGNS